MSENEELAAVEAPEAVAFCDHEGPCNCPKTPSSVAIRAALAGLIEALELADLPGYVYDSDQAECVECGHTAKDIASIGHEDGCLMEKVEAARAALATPCPAELRDQAVDDFIDNHGVTCDCCQHVMIDVTAAKDGTKGHCVAGDPEGEGSACAVGWHEYAGTTEAQSDEVIDGLLVDLTAIRAKLVEAEALLLAVQRRQESPRFDAQGDAHE